MKIHDFLRVLELVFFWFISKQVLVSYRSYVINDFIIFILDMIETVSPDSIRLHFLEYDIFFGMKIFPNSFFRAHFSTTIRKVLKSSEIYFIYGQRKKLHMCFCIALNIHQSIYTSLFFV